MKLRQDAWLDENDELLAEAVIRHVKEGSTQLKTASSSFRYPKYRFEHL